MQPAAEALPPCSCGFLRVGEHVRHSTGGHRGVVRYIGRAPELDPKPKVADVAAAAVAVAAVDAVIWAGVEWAAPKGKNDGSTPFGTRYFQCAPSHGSMIRLGCSSEVSSATRPHPSCVLLPERSLCDVLIDRYGAAEETGGTASTSSPFAQCPATGAFINVTQVSCNASVELQVVRSAGSRLGLLFPQLSRLAVVSTLLGSWVDVFDIARALPSLDHFTVSDNLIDPATFPDDPAVEGVAASRSVALFNCTNTKLPQSRVWRLLALFPCLRELFMCDNGMDSFPAIDGESDGVKATLASLTHIAIAQNAFASLDSLHAAMFAAVTTMPGSGDSHLETLTASHCLGLTELCSRGLAARLVAERDARDDATTTATGGGWRLYPRLAALLVRETGINTWDALWRMVDPCGAVVGATVTDVSLLGMRLFTDDAPQDALMSGLRRANGDSPLDDRSLRMLVTAMLPPSVARINNTAVERTNWFGVMTDTAGRPELRDCRLWTARRIAALLLAASDSSPPSSSGDLIASLPVRARALVAECARDAEAAAAMEGGAASPPKPAQPRMLEHTFDVRVVPIFASDATETLSLIASSFRDVIESALRSSGPRRGGGAEAAQLSGQGGEQERHSTSTGRGVMQIDVRWSARDLELAVADHLGFGREYAPPKTHATPEAWVITEQVLKPWRIALKQREPDAVVAARRAEAERLWRNVFPAGSLALWIVDAELADVPRAVELELHLKQLLRPATPLHSLRVSATDVVLAVVN